MVRRLPEKLLQNPYVHLFSRQSAIFQSSPCKDADKFVFIGCSEDYDLIKEVHSSWALEGLPQTELKFTICLKYRLKALWTIRTTKCQVEALSLKETACIDGVTGGQQPAAGKPRHLCYRTCSKFIRPIREYVEIYLVENGAFWLVAWKMAHLGRLHHRRQYVSITWDPLSWNDANQLCATVSSKWITEVLPIRSDTSGTHVSTRWSVIWIIWMKKFNV